MKETLRKWSLGTECSDCRHSAITESELFRLSTVVVSRFSNNGKVTLRKWSLGTECSDCRHSAITESEIFRLSTVVVGCFSSNGKVTLRKWSLGTECSDCRYSGITEQHLFVSANVEMLSSRRLTLEGWWSLSIDHSDTGSVAPGAPHLSMAPPGGISFTGLQFHPRLLF